MKDSVFKWALKNAIEHGGKAQPGAIIPKVIGEHSELKTKAKEIAKEAAKAVSEINKMTIEQQVEKLKEIAPELLEKKSEEKKDVPALPGAEQGEVVMIFPPEPSKYATIGHAKACFLNYLSAKKYDGRFIIRFEDTSLNKVKKEFYDLMLEDLKWLGIKWDDVDYVSSHIEKMYDYATKLIKKEKAYMCNCDPENIHKMRAEEKECNCRSRKFEENLELWNNMLEGKFKQGNYSLRAKIDMCHKNAAMRDPTIMRVSIGKHPRVGEKYIVWPMYDFATAIMDEIEGVTHRIRSKEFEMRAEIQKWIQKELDIKSPVILEFARFNLEGIPASGRAIREKLESGELIGWDDPRLPTLLALRKRGFQPEAIKNFAINSGISKTESTITWEVLEAENRKIIESIADRYFFVSDKIKLKVRGIPKEFFSERLKHPDYPEHGKVKYNLEDDEAEFYVDKHDFIDVKQDSLYRLMDLMNIKIDVREETQIIAEFESKDYKPGMKIIHWVFEKENVPVEILMLNAEYNKGFGEKELQNLDDGAIVQFIRFGYCILDKKGKTLKFRFTHK